MTTKKVIPYGLAAALFLCDANSYSKIEPTQHVSYVEDARTCEPGPSLVERLASPEEAAEQLNKRSNYGLTPENIVFLTRLLYFEGAFDRKAATADDLAFGYRAMASVILNRFAFDQDRDTRYFGRSLMDVATQKIAKRRRAFSCLDETHNKKYFDPKSFQDSTGTYLLGSRDMDPKRTQLAYEALVDVLEKRVLDPTDGATFYKADYAKVRWQGTQALSDRKDCVLRFTLKINTHRFYAVDCGLDGIADAESPTGLL